MFWRDLLSDKKLRAGLIRASKPTEGFVPRSFAADVYEGGRDYEIEQAKIDRLKAADQTQFQANFEFLKEKFPEKTNEDIREIALSLNSKSKNATAISTLFKALSDDPANAGKPATELWNQATIMVTGNAGAGGTSLQLTQGLVTLLILPKKKRQRRHHDSS